VLYKVHRLAKARSHPHHFQSAVCSKHCADRQIVNLLVDMPLSQLHSAPSQQRSTLQVPETSDTASSAQIKLMQKHSTPIPAELLSLPNPSLAPEADVAVESTSVLPYLEHVHPHRHRGHWGNVGAVPPAIPGSAIPCFGSQPAVHELWALQPLAPEVTVRSTTVLVKGLSIWSTAPL
jgi:hypothetical protein